MSRVLKTQQVDVQLIKTSARNIYVTMSVASFEARLSAEGHTDSKQSCTECAQTFLTGSPEIYVKIQKKQLQQDSYLKREKNKTEDGLI